MEKQKERDGQREKFRQVLKEAESLIGEVREELEEKEQPFRQTEALLPEGVNDRSAQLQEQALAFKRPYLYRLTSIQKQPSSQGLFYRRDGRPCLRLWLKNAFNVELEVNDKKYIFLELDKNIWELTLELEPGFHYVTLAVDGAEVLSPYLQTGYGFSRPCNYLEIGPMEPFLKMRPVACGSIRHEYYFSTVTGNMETCIVYTPPGYDSSGRKYPVLYLQHGFGENETSWVWQGRIRYIMDNLLADHKAAPMIIVMADGMVSEALPNGERRLKHEKFAEELFSDLIPFIESSFRVLAQKKSRAIAGLSMGSMQTAIAAFTQPHMFGWVGLFSGFMRNYIGVKEPDASHLTEILSKPAEERPQFELLFRAMGREDNFFPFFMQEDQLCEDYGIRHMRRVYEGGHDWNVWRRCACEFLQLIFR